MVAPAAGLFARYIHERAHSAEGAQSNVQCTEAPSGIDSTALQPHGGYCVPSGHLEPVGTLEPVRPQSKNKSEVAPETLTSGASYGARTQRRLDNR
jgi:hypothetical protein